MRLSGNDLLVFSAIRLHATPLGVAFPSMARIAELTGVLRNHIPRHLKRLEACGILHRSRRAGLNPKAWQHNAYQVDMTFTVPPLPMLTESTMGVTKNGDRGVTKNGALTSVVRSFFQDRSGSVDSKLGITGCRDAVVVPFPGTTTNTIHPLDIEDYDNDPPFEGEDEERA